MLEQGYGILPNSILYSTELTDKQKLLFSCVSSLCAETGYCFAGNDWFIQKGFAKNKETITRNLKELEKLGFIQIAYEETKSISKKRLISVDSKVNARLILKSTAVDSKVNHNNTSNNNTSIKKEYMGEFLEFIKNNPDSPTSKIADRFIKLGWNPKQPVENFREWLTNLANLHELQPTQLNEINERWYVYWLGIDDRDIKNFKSTFGNCPYLPKNQKKGTKSK